MLVVRITNIIKREHKDELVAAVRARVEAGKYPHAVRIYEPMFGPIDVLNLELEFESLDEFQNFQAKADPSNDPEIAAFFEKVVEARLPGGSQEVWKLLS